MVFGVIFEHIFFMLIKRIKSTDNFDFFSIESIEALELPMMLSQVEAGFPSPADDYIDLSIDLNRELVRNPSSTFLVRVKGLSMVDAHIFPDDILVVDKSLEPQNGKIAVCFLDGQFTLKRIKFEGKTIWLMPENKKFNPIKIEGDNELTIWGIVTFVIKKV